MKKIERLIDYIYYKIGKLIARNVYEKQYIEWNYFLSSIQKSWNYLAVSWARYDKTYWEKANRCANLYIELFRECFELLELLKEKESEYNAGKRKNS